MTAAPELKRWERWRVPQKQFFDPPRGLTQAEAKERLEAFGPNEVSTSTLGNKVREASKFFVDPMGLMLLGLSALYAVLGDKTDALILLAAWLPVTAVDVVLELRAGAAVKALRASLSPVAKVLRDGSIVEIPTRNIVKGDLLVFEEGQNLPADGSIAEEEHLTINEAALTGESMPVEKAGGGQFLAGTQVVTGRALGLVEKTGKETRFGGIAQALEEVERVSSPLKRRVDQLVRWVLAFAGALAVFLLLLEFFRTQQFIPSLIVALTFAMSAIPEEFPLVFTLYLSLGAWRLSRRRVLVKSLPAVETLGSTDVLCTDKTGTLTEGRFQLETIVSIAGDDDEELGLSALLSCEVHPVDSLEAAIAQHESARRPRLQEWRLVWDYPFEKNGKHMTHVWFHTASGQYRVVMKGAVEGVLEHCRVEPASRSKIEEHVGRLSSEGNRLLGLAWRDGQATGDRARDETDLKFRGILVFSDPIRCSAADAIARCQEAGIEVKMLTGDHPLTAHAIADQVGIVHAHDRMFSGSDLAKLDRDGRRGAYLDGAIFSRVLPEHKHELVKVLQENGKVVAMTGDGINDAPALKVADVGISMGHSATDVARSAAQIVLLESDFSGIVAAMLEGKRILSCLRRSFSYLISFHVPVVLLTLLPPILAWPALLLPVHIILLELVVHPVSAFTFENMRVRGTAARGSRKGALISLPKVIRAGLAGLLVSLSALACYRFFLLSHDVDQARSVAFSAVLMGNVAFVLSEALPEFGVRVGTTILLLISSVLVISWEPISVLHLAPIGGFGAVLATLAGSLGILPRLWVKVSLE